MEFHKTLSVLQNNYQFYIKIISSTELLSSESRQANNERSITSTSRLATRDENDVPLLNCI